MTSAVASARVAGLEMIISSFTLRSANRLPIFATSRLPRSANGRSRSGNEVSSQLDLAWRTRNSVFIALILDVFGGGSDSYYITAAWLQIGFSPEGSVMARRAPHGENHQLRLTAP